eukprot:NODE_16_length_49026_cov_1.035992.p1 type:complete len:870 gc:universal NODE_16_length_49026_cov_1.035992:28374-25765(-)
MTLDVDSFDALVQRSILGDQNAMRELEQFQNDPNSWTSCDVILGTCKQDQSKVIALNVLANFIKTHYKVIPVDQQQGLKSFLMSLMVNQHSHPVLSKLHLTMIAILKHEWMPSFIHDLIESAKTSVLLCENHLKFLKLLSEEIFEFSSMTTQKQLQSKEQFNKEFTDIFYLCHQVLQKQPSPSLVQATLQCILRFLIWIPVGYIYETDMIDLLLKYFKQFPLDVIRCCVEIMNIKDKPLENAKLFTLVIAQITTFEDEVLAQAIALFITSAITNHLGYIEQSEEFNHAITIYFQISRQHDVELFKVCLEGWYFITENLIKQQPQQLSMPQRIQLYTPILSELRHLAISKMVRPKEVLLVTNDENEVVREEVKDTESLQLYASMKQLLVNLCKLDPQDTEQIFTTKLDHVCHINFNRDELNQLCWAVGTISGAMDEDAEKRYLVHVIRELLNLCEIKKGKDTKAVIASNIMYVCGQYPQFLRKHYKFLKTVINKLFEFMHESHEGVQDMACDTFITICDSPCKHELVVAKSDEPLPFIEQVLGMVPNIISDLNTQQISSVYQGIGIIIHSASHSVQERYVVELMSNPNQAWQSILAQLKTNINQFEQMETVKLASHFLQINRQACSTIKDAFYIQIQTLIDDLVKMYELCSQLITTYCQANPNVGPAAAIVKYWRSVKKETLRLFATFCKMSGDAQKPFICNLIAPRIFGPFITIEKSLDENLKEAEILFLFSGLIDSVQGQMMSSMFDIFDYLFSHTLNMINRDFSEYPDHRKGFYDVLLSSVKHCFQAVYKLNPEQFKLFLDSVAWGFKHTQADIMELGLEICMVLVQKISVADSEISIAFYQQFFLGLLQDIFYVLTDADHKAGNFI